MNNALANLSLREQLHVDRRLLRLLWLFVGLTGFGVGMGMIIRAGLGAAPWDVFAVAVADRTSLSFGAVTILTSFMVLLAWIPLRQQPEIGTLANALWVGIAADATLHVIPSADALGAAIGLLIGGVAVNAVADAVYIGAQLGPGPRDGLMTGMHHRFRFPVGPVRFVVEAVVLLVGWMLGGPVGAGTLLYAVAIGPIVHTVLPRVTLRVRNPDPERSHRPGAAPDGKPTSETTDHVCPS